MTGHWNGLTASRAWDQRFLSDETSNEINSLSFTTPPYRMLQKPRHKTSGALRCHDDPEGKSSTDNLKRRSEANRLVSLAPVLYCDRTSLLHSPFHKFISNMLRLLNFVLLATLSSIFRAHEVHEHDADQMPMGYVKYPYQYSMGDTGAFQIEFAV